MFHLKNKRFMKKFFLAAMTALLSLGLGSCSSDNDGIQEDKPSKSIYKVDVVQEGDLSLWNITAGVNGVSGTKDGLFNSEDGTSVGMAYVLTEKEATKGKWSYRTNEEGVWISAVVTAFKKLEVEDKAGVLKVTAKVYLNDKLLGQKEKIFTGEEEQEEPLEINSIDYSQK